MYIRTVELKNFRNYEDLSMEFDPQVNLIVGRNAQGKTNLLEAVCLSSIGRSFRTARDSEMIRFGSDFARVRVSAEKRYIDTKVEVSIHRMGRSSRKQIRKDGSLIQRTSELIENIIIVVFSPEDLKIVKDEPEKRRKFIDRELSQIKPAYFAALSGYKKALAQRNAFLKQENIDISMLDLWDQQLVQYGSEIIRLRKEFIDKISVFSGRIHRSITNGTEELRLAYEPNIQWFPDRSDQRMKFMDVLMESREKDLRLRTTTRGPHKDDLLFFIGDINVRNFGSQGQQRTCALSLKLAELDFIREETGEEGILLLDDVMSELDEQRRMYLVKTLDKNQLFITMTDIDQSILDAYPDAEIIRVTDGCAEVKV